MIRIVRGADADPFDPGQGFLTNRVRSSDRAFVGIAPGLVPSTGLDLRGGPVTIRVWVVLRLAL
jgi:hypothetical protein